MKGLGIPKRELLRFESISLSNITLKTILGIAGIVLTVRCSGARHALRETILYALFILQTDNHFTGATT